MTPLARSRLRRRLSLALACAAIAPLPAVRAQRPAKVYRIGVLAIGAAQGTIAQTEAFRAEMRRLGLVEGTGYVVEVHAALNDPTRLDALAAEVVASRPDVIVSDGGTFVALAAQKATATLPIVFGAVGDPVARRLVASLARPGGNLTGNALMADDLDLKRIQLLYELLPKDAEVAVLAGPLPQIYRQRYSDRLTGALAPRRAQVFFVDARDDLAPAFERIAQARLKAVALNASPLILLNQDRVAALVAQYRLPAIAEGRELSAAGLLLTYSNDFDEMTRRTARYVHDVLLGARPADLPVQQATSFKLVVNLKTARTLAIKVPASMLALADEVIE